MLQSVSVPDAKLKNLFCSSLEANIQVHRKGLVHIDHIAGQGYLLPNKVCRSTYRGNNAVPFMGALWIFTCNKYEQYQNKLWAVSYRLSTH